MESFWTAWHWDMQARAATAGSVCSQHFAGCMAVCCMVILSTTCAGGVPHYSPNLLIWMGGVGSGSRPLNSHYLRLTIFAQLNSTQFILTLCCTYLYYSYGHLTTKISKWLRGLGEKDVGMRSEGLYPVCVCVCVCGVYVTSICYRTCVLLLCVDAMPAAAIRHLSLPH